MVLRVLLAALAALVLVACGQAEGIATPDSTPETAAPLPGGGSPTPAAADATAGIGDATATPAPAEAATPASSPTPDSAGATATPSPAPFPTPSATASAAAPTDPPPSGQGDSSSNIVTRAQAALAATLNVAPETLSLVEAQEQEWSDSALGCPSPNEAYMQVITPGQRIVFSDGGATYDVHTDARGGRMVWCDAGRPVALQQP